MNFIPGNRKQIVIGWCIQVHTLDDTPVQIDSITVEAGCPSRRG